MTEKLTLHASVLYGDVDRNEVLLLRGVFKLLQEAAIAHANQFDLGSNAMVTRGETWMLNRIAVEVLRYPRYEEKLRIETWSCGIKGFKGYREFRVFDAQGQLVFSGSSLWLYVNTRTKTIIRVPKDLAATFPVVNDGVFCPDLESHDYVLPSPETSACVTIGIRYSDIDVNAHVNNTAYPDFLQAALARTGQPPLPRRVALKYMKSISADLAQVNVRLEPCGEASTVFAIENDGTVFAVGEVS